MAELVREIHIKASPEVIFGYLTDPAKYIEWGGSDAELDPRPGGTYRVLMGGTHQSAGEFLEVVPNERVLFSFGWRSRAIRSRGARPRSRSASCPTRRVRRSA